MSGSIATQLQDSLRELHLPTFRENCHAQAVAGGPGGGLLCSVPADPV